MRYVDMDKIIPVGCYLARPVCNDNGAVLMRQGGEITENLLNRLAKQNYVGLYIEDEISKGIEIEDVVDESLRLQASDALKECLKKKLDFGRLSPIISNIIDSVISNRDKLIQVNHLQNYNEYLYAHSVNVAILSIRIGLEFGLNMEKLSQLAMAGILHDIGKNMVSPEIVNKVGKLTPEEFLEMKKHPIFSYEMTKDSPRIASVSRVAILDHHERRDGSGYPRALSGDNISLFGKILGVTDTYDAMTTDRVYRGAYSVADVTEFFMANSNVLFDFDLIKAFTRCIAVYPTGSIVELSTGQRAIIVKNYNDCILRPYIRLLDDMTEIDLKDDSKYLGVSIMKVI